MGQKMRVISHVEFRVQGLVGIVGRSNLSQQVVKVRGSLNNDDDLGITA